MTVPTEAGCDRYPGFGVREQTQPATPWAMVRHLPFRFNPPSPRSQNTSQGASPILSVRAPRVGGLWPCGDRARERKGRAAPDASGRAVQPVLSPGQTAGVATTGRRADAEAQSVRRPATEEARETGQEHRELSLMSPAAAMRLWSAPRALGTVCHCSCSMSRVCGADCSGMCLLKLTDANVHRRRLEACAASRTGMKL